MHRRSRLPGTPGEVIASADRIAVELVVGQQAPLAHQRRESTGRSSTAVLAISAVAA